MFDNEVNEKRFESDIESALISPAGGYVKGEDIYDPKFGLFVDTLIDFIQRTQPRDWFGLRTQICTELDYLSRNADEAYNKTENNLSN